MGKNIFILEDDIHIQELLKYNLTKDGHTVKAFGTAKEMFLSRDLRDADLFILDIMLPDDMDGYLVCRKLKESKNTSEIPIIFLSARSEEFDTVLGLELGADDYIKKPFGVKELLSRVKAVLRRSMASQTSDIENISAGNIEIDPEKHIVYKDKAELTLPLKEYELLKVLMENTGKVLTRDHLLENVWGFEYSGETRTVDVHIRYLRRKIETDPSKPQHILTVRGIGYKYSDRLDQR
jgi:two-component system, OmpR family, alkaline phosphatase synthesis response regulator PhoP